MNKTTLVKKIAASTGFTQKDVLTVVDELFNTIITEIKNDEISISGFGKFVTSERPARIMRNPATGGQVEVPARKGLKFKPAKAFKDAVNA